MRNFVFVIAAIWSTPSFGNLPLNVETLIAKDKSFRLNIDFSYVNIESEGLSAEDAITVQTDENTFISIPTSIGKVKTNTDILIHSLGIDYGISPNTEIYVRGSCLSRETRILNTDNSTTATKESECIDGSIGLSSQLASDNQTPALIVFAESAIYEKHTNDHAVAKSWLFGATMYRSIDPIVMVFTSVYRWNQSRKHGEWRYTPGNYLLLNPSISFAVNERVTLSGGIQWRNTYANKYDERKKGFRQTSTDLILGFGYGVSKGNIINL